MPAPVAHQTSAFSAKDVHDFLFTYSGNQVFKNRFVVRNNTTNAIVYDKIQTSMQLVHSLPSGSLSNGICYNAVISVFENNDMESKQSSPIIFYCYTTPIFTFENLIPEQIIESSHFEPKLSYSQTEGELLNSYQILLCNDANTVLQSSGVKYDNKLSAPISGLTENSHYKLKGVGETLNGIKLDTGYVPFYAKYMQPNMFTMVELHNVPENASVRLNSHIVSIEGYVGIEPAVFMENTMLDLTNPKNYVLFNEGVLIQSDFTIRIKGKSFAINEKLLELSNQKNTVELFCRNGNFKSSGIGLHGYFDLRVQSGEFTYMTQSNFTTIPTNNDMVLIWIRRKNNYYEVKTEILSGR